MKCGAKVSVVAAVAHLEIRAMAAQGKVTLEKREFRDKDLNGRNMVFCATNDRKLNMQISMKCKEKRIWVNVADDPSLCDFIVPAIAKRGDVICAVSTGGASPAMAKFLRKKIERLLGKI